MRITKALSFSAALALFVPLYACRAERAPSPAQLSTDRAAGDDPARMNLSVPPALAAVDPFEQPSRITLVAERAVQGIVHIEARKLAAPERRGRSIWDFFSRPRNRRGGNDGTNDEPRGRGSGASGSGVIINRDGVVVTNSHVVRGRDRILVTLYSGEQLPAEVIGTDPKTDIAVIRLEGDLPELSPIPLGDSTKVRLGQVVLAIGSSLGLTHSVTMGIVSATGRSELNLSRVREDYENFIQTDAVINPGNSGGALVNLQGEVIGINTAIMTQTGSYQGIGLAVPSELAGFVVRSFLEHGRMIRAWIGVRIRQSPEGVLVDGVVDAGPAMRAGLEGGDVIVAVNDRKIDRVSVLRRKVAAMPVGTTITLEVLRDGKPMLVEIVLEELPTR